MDIGKKIRIPEVQELGCKEFFKELCEDDRARKIKLYLVPSSVSESRIYCAEYYRSESEVVPPCKVKDARLLTDYVLYSDGEIDIKYLCGELSERA